MQYHFYCLTSWQNFIKRRLLNCTDMFFWMKKALHLNHEASKVSCVFLSPAACISGWYNSKDLDYPGFHGERAPSVCCYMKNVELSPEIKVH